MREVIIATYCWSWAGRSKQAALESGEGRPWRACNQVATTETSHWTTLPPLQVKPAPALTTAQPAPLPPQPIGLDVREEETPLS